VDAELIWDGAVILIISYVDRKAAKTGRHDETQQTFHIVTNAIIFTS